jgi:hypothetical protein
VTTGHFTFDYPALMAWLVECAENGLPAPTNDAIAGRFGRKSSNAGSRSLAMLERQGLISVIRYKRSRVVVILETGKHTAKVEPVEKRVRCHPQQVVDRVIELARAKYTVPEIAKELSLPHKAVRGLYDRNREQITRQDPKPTTPRPQLMAIGPARTCQFITGTDYLARMNRGENIYCSRTSVEGRSWCAEHKALCLVKSKEKAA